MGLLFLSVSVFFSFQYWLGGSPENVESLLLTLAKSYVPEVMEMESVMEKDIAEPVLLPDKGIWHPVADKVFENADEYLAWYNKVRAACCSYTYVRHLCLSFGDGRHSFKSRFYISLGVS